MVFNQLSKMVQLQWQHLRNALDAKGHEHRMHQRLEKKQAKQKRKATRRAMREARRAKRKERHKLLSPTIIDEHANDVFSSSSDHGIESNSTPETCSKDSAHFAEALLADDGAVFIMNDTTGGQPDRLQSNIGVSTFSKETVESKVTVYAVATVPKIPIEITLEVKPQLDQKQCNFYDSLGGYSTVDEEEDELRELRTRSHRESDAELDVHNGSATVSPTAKKDLHPSIHEKQPGDNIVGSGSSPVTAESSLEMFSTRSLKSLFETEHIDELINLELIDEYRTFDKETSRSFSVADNEYDGLRALSSKISVAMNQSSDVGTISDLNRRATPSSKMQELEVSFDSRVETVPNTNEFLNVNLSAEYSKSSFAMVKNGLIQASTTLPRLLSKEVYGAIEPPRQHLNGNIFNVKTESEPSVSEAVVKMTEKNASQPVAFLEKEMIAGDFGMPDKAAIHEYASSIYESLCAREHRYHVTENIFAKQQSVRPKMRAVLVDWLVEVHQRFELETQTLFLTVNYIDRYLAQISVQSQRFQLVGVAALLIASKFEEIYPCDMDDLLYICERSYAKDDLVDCERSLLNVLNFNLAVPSVSSFLGYYLSYFDEEDELIGQLASYFAERSLMDFTFGATYEPSIIASSCLLVAHCYAKGQAPSLVWSSRLEDLTGYAAESITPCTRDLWLILTQPCELVAVATKYSTKEFGEVAHLPLENLKAVFD
ncbi:putative cyclin B3, G2/mitotic-specific, Cyclin-like superfamily [Plasmopara halstedii]